MNNLLGNNGCQMLLLPSLFMEKYFIPHLLDREATENRGPSVVALREMWQNTDVQEFYLKLTLKTVFYKTVHMKE